MVNLFEKGPSDSANLISAKFINNNIEDSIYDKISTTLELQILTKVDDEEDYELEDWCEYPLIDISTLDKDIHNYVMENVKTIKTSEEDTKKMTWL